MERLVTKERGSHSYGEIPAAILGEERSQKGKKLGTTVTIWRKKKKEGLTVPRKDSFPEKTPRVGPKKGSSLQRRRKSHVQQKGKWNESKLTRPRDA